MFCHRKAFDAVGGFDDSLDVVEDLALSWVLSRQGEFVVLPERVVPSGRNLRA